MNVYLGRVACIDADNQGTGHYKNIFQFWSTVQNLCGKNPFPLLSACDLCRLAIPTRSFQPKGKQKTKACPGRVCQPLTEQLVQERVLIPSKLIRVTSGKSEGTLAK